MTGQRPVEEWSRVEFAGWVFDHLLKYTNRLILVAAVGAIIYGFGPYGLY